MSVPLLLVAIGCSYLIGSLPTAYLLTKWLKGVDVRQVGSGNAGATNVARVVGKGAGVTVLLVDILKGVVAVTCIPRGLVWLGGQELPMAWPLLCGVAVVLGHDWSCFLQFSGGKGIATSGGVLLGLRALDVLGITTLLWGISFACTRVVSLSSLIAAAALPVAFWAFRYGGMWIAFGAVLGALAIYRHSANIQRLLKGVEKPLP